MRNGALNVLGVSATTPVPLATLVVPRRGLHSAAMDTPDVFGTCSLSLAQGLGSTVQPRCLFQHFIPGECLRIWKLRFSCLLLRDVRFLSDSARCALYCCCVVGRSEFALLVIVAPVLIRLRTTALVVAVRWSHRWCEHLFTTNRANWKDTRASGARRCLEFRYRVAVMRCAPLLAGEVQLVLFRQSKQIFDP